MTISFGSNIDLKPLSCPYKVQFTVFQLKLHRQYIPKTKNENKFEVFFYSLSTLGNKPFLGIKFQHYPIAPTRN